MSPQAKRKHRWTRSSQDLVSTRYFVVQKAILFIRINENLKTSNSKVT